MATIPVVSITGLNTPLITPKGPPPKYNQLIQGLIDELDELGFDVKPTTPDPFALQLSGKPPEGIEVQINGYYWLANIEMDGSTFKISTILGEDNIFKDISDPDFDPDDIIMYIILAWIDESMKPMRVQKCY